MDSVKRTQAYYDSTDADLFYRTAWGGEDIHIGLYSGRQPSVRAAGRATVDHMLRLLPAENSHQQVLDLGAGYGGAARHIVRQKVWKVTCLNLSNVENDYNRQRNREEGLTEKIDVVEGNFVEVPYGKNRFDIVWSEDAFLHSSAKKQVLAEAYRVLKPGGILLFTDPMQADTCPANVLGPILQRLQLEELASPAFYRQAARQVGFATTQFFDLSQHLTRHYQAILQALHEHETELQQKGCSADYLTNMANGLEHWIKGGQKGWLSWGIFRMRKPK